MSSTTSSIRPAGPITPKSDLEVLCQEIDSVTATYRIRAGKKRVHFVTMPARTWDPDTMRRSFLLIEKLPHLPDDEWTRMRLWRNPRTLYMQWEFSYAESPGLEGAWHPRMIDVLSLKEIGRYRKGVSEVVYEYYDEEKGESVRGRGIAKIACFDGDIARTEHEMWVYSKLEDAKREAEGGEESGSQLAPAFLANLTQNGKVIGMLLEKLQGGHPGPKDLPACEEALRRFHKSLDLIHGDIKRTNFIFDRPKGKIRLVDFEDCEMYDEGLGLEELDSLPSKLEGPVGPGLISDIPYEGPD